MARRSKEFRATNYHRAIGHAVMERQTKIGLSLEELADRARLVPEELRQIIAAEREGQLTELMGVAAGLGLQVSELLHRAEVIEQQSGAKRAKRAKRRKG